MHLSSFTGKTVEIDKLDHESFYNELMKRVATSRRKLHVTETVAGDMSDTF
jgi:hypothetical protein